MSFFFFRTPSKTFVAVTRHLKNVERIDLDCLKIFLTADTASTLIYGGTIVFRKIPRKMIPMFEKRGGL